MGELDSGVTFHSDMLWHLLIGLCSVVEVCLDGNGCEKTNNAWDSGDVLMIKDKHLSRETLESVISSAKIIGAPTEIEITKPCRIHSSVVNIEKCVFTRGKGTLFVGTKAAFVLQNVVLSQCSDLSIFEMENSNVSLLSVNIVNCSCASSHVTNSVILLDSVNLTQTSSFEHVITLRRCNATINSVIFHSSRCFGFLLAKDACHVIGHSFAAMKSEFHIVFDLNSSSLSLDSFTLSWIKGELLAAEKCAIELRNSSILGIESKKLVLCESGTICVSNFLFSEIDCRNLFLLHRHESVQISNVSLKQSFLSETAVYCSECHSFNLFAFNCDNLVSKADISLFHVVNSTTIAFHTVFVSRILSNTRHSVAFAFSAIEKANVSDVIYQSNTEPLLLMKDTVCVISALNFFENIAFSSHNVIDLAGITAHDSDLQITNSNFKKNSIHGGVIMIVNSLANVTNVVFESNSITGLSIESEIRFHDCLFNGSTETLKLHQTAAVVNSCLFCCNVHSDFFLGNISTLTVEDTITNSSLFVESDDTANSLSLSNVTTQEDISKMLALGRHTKLGTSNGKQKPTTSLHHTEQMTPKEQHRSSRWLILIMPCIFLSCFAFLWFRKTNYRRFLFTPRAFLRRHKRL